MAKESAEEKLLKMMQKSGSSVADSGTSAAASGTAAAGAGLKNKFKFAFTIMHLNQLLLLGIVLCIVALVIEMRSGMDMLKQSVDLTDEGAQSAKISDIALPSTPDAKFYLDALSVRNIFRPFEAPTVKSTPAAQSLAKRMSKYKLVGVAWLDLPETASIMIEDTTNKNTYFLKQGEQLENVTVKTIYTDRAVFSYENEETTIKL